MFLLVAPAYATPSNIALSEAEYKELTELAADIESRFPLNEYIYVGIGRAPTPLIRFFQELSPHAAVNLPFRVPPAFFTAPQTEMLFNHFQKFLPKSQLQAGRKILLISYDGSGETLKTLYNHLCDYYDREKSLLRRFGMIPTHAILDRRVHSLALAPPGREKSISGFLWDQRHTIQSLAHFPLLAKKLALGGFDRWSQYDSYSPADGAKSKPLVERAEYEALGQEILEHMYNDPEILMLTTKVLRCTEMLVGNGSKPSGSE